MGDSTNELEIKNIDNSINYKNVPKLVFVCSILCLSSFYFGYCLTYISTINPHILATYFGQNAGEETVIGILIGSLVVGAAAGALITPFLLGFLSRKYALVFTQKQHPSD